MWLLKKSGKEVESKKALEEANENLKRTQKRSEEVTKVTSELRSLREKNHFAEQLASIMGGSR